MMTRKPMRSQVVASYNYIHVLLSYFIKRTCALNGIDEHLICLCEREEEKAKQNRKKKLKPRTRDHFV